jgi:hypothetical protein
MLLHPDVEQLCQRLREISMFNPQTKYKNYLKEVPWTLAVK